ncbi:MAG: hypothetical protein ACK45A_23720, partial [Planctomyces sp.]
MKHLALQLSLLAALAGCSGSSSEPPAATADQTPQASDPAQQAPAAAGNSQATVTPPIQGTGRPQYFRFSSKLADSGIDFVQVSGNSPDKPFPAANGTGCGILDVELDGRPDIYFACGAKFPL